MMSPEMIGIIGTAALTLLGGAAMWGRTSKTVETLEATDGQTSRELAQARQDTAALEDKMRTEVKAQMDEIWRWKQRHEHETEEKRRDYDREITTLKVTGAANDASYKEILRRLESMENLVREEIRIMRDEMKTKEDRK